MPFYLPLVLLALVGILILATTELARAKQQELPATTHSQIVKPRSALRAAVTLISAALRR